MIKNRIREYRAKYDMKQEDLAKLVRFGARKINIGTALRMEFGQTLRRQFADDPKEFDRIKLFGPCMEAVKDKAVQKMELL